MYNWLINEAVAASRIAVDLTGAALTTGDHPVALVGLAGISIGMLMGMACLSVFYGLGLFFVLRENFLLWHAIRNLIMILMTVMIWPFPLGDILPYGSDLRVEIGIFAFIISSALQNLFLRDFVEAGNLTPRLMAAMKWGCIALSISSFAIFMPLPPMALAVIIGIPGFALMIIQSKAFNHARSMQSRSIRFAMTGLIPITIVFALCLVNYLIHGSFGGYFLLFGPGAFMFEVTATALGISDRIFGLRMQRDIAVRGQQRAEQKAITDALTELPNRRGLEKYYAENSATIIAVAIVDLDHFKSLNDDFGHDVGDDVLRSVAKALRHPNVYSARLGGEEFVILFENEPAESLAEEVRTNITQRVAWDIPKLPVSVTASTGFMRITKGTELAEALKAADIALYSAKAAGRNRMIGSNPVCIIDDLGKWGQDQLPMVGNS